MNFLENLAKKVYTTVNSVASRLGSSNQTASAANAVKSSATLPNSSTSFSLIDTAVKSQKAPTPQLDKISTQATKAKVQQGLSGSSSKLSVNYNPSSVRSATRSTGSSTERTTNSEGRLGTLNTKSGKFTPDPQGAQGESGVTSQQFNSSGSTFNPLAASAGRTGISGTSAYTGLLTASGSGLNTPSIFGTDEENRDDGDRFKDTLIRSTSNALGTVFPALKPVIAGLRLVQNPFGMSRQLSQQPLDATDYGSPIAAETLTVTPEARETLQSKEAMRTDDYDEVVSSIENAAQQKYEELSQTDSFPEPEITKEQRGFLDSLFDNEERESLSSTLQDLREATGLNEAENLKNDTIRQMQSLNSAFDSFYEDLRNNPDMPKGLAQRRLATLSEQHKTKLQALNNQLELVNDTITTANTRINQALQIEQLEEDREERKRDNARQLVSMFIESGAIAGISNADLVKLADSSGAPISALSAARNAARSVSPDIEIQKTDSHIIGFDKATGKIAYKISTSSGTGGGGSGGASSQAAIYAKALSEGKVTIANVPQAYRADALSELDRTGQIILSGTQRATILSVSQADTALGELETLLTALKSDFAGSPVERLTKGVSLKTSAFTQSNKDAALFEAKKASLLATLARATGEKGTLTDQDIDRVKGQLPDLTDTYDLATEKLAQSRNLLRALKAEAVNTFTSPASGITDYDLETADSGDYSGNLFEDLNN